MSRIELPLLVACVSLFAATDAAAGWYMKQNHSSASSQEVRTAELYYDHHKLRVDSPKEPSVVIDLATGDFTYMDHGKKQYSQISLDGLIALRDRMMKAMEAQLERMPPEVRGQVEGRMKALKEAESKSLELKNTGKKDAVGGHACEVYTWTAMDGDGEACITSKLPVDVGAFRQDATSLGKKLTAKGVGSAATSMPMLQVAEHGFPLRTKRVMQMGPSKVESSSEVVEMKKQSVDASRFAPPKDYEKQDFERMMSQGMPGRQGP